MSGSESASVVSTSVLNYSKLASACHPDCVACRDPAAGGLGLRFDLGEDGAVMTRFFCAPQYQGYPDRLHGGIIATVLDAAMTHCLFARNCRGVTAKLAVRYVRPVHIGAEATITAAVSLERGILVELQAELFQGGELCVSSQATFFVEKSSGGTRSQDRRE